MISRKRLYQNLTNPNTGPSADLALLFLSMKMMIQIPPEGESPAHSLLYTAAKRFMAIVEASAICSVQLIQSAVLITAYEVGHGIYPAAYLSSGHVSPLVYLDYESVKPCGSDLATFHSGSCVSPKILAFQTSNEFLQCARLGHALGIHAKRDTTPQMLRRPGTWTEQEETRRVWWAVLLLDR